MSAGATAERMGLWTDANCLQWCYSGGGDAAGIQPQFIEGRGFSEGRALVKLYDQEGVLQWGYMDPNGKFV